MLDYNNTAQQEIFESHDFGHLSLKQMIPLTYRDLFLTPYQFQGKGKFIKQESNKRGGLILVESGSRTKEGGGASIS